MSENMEGELHQGLSFFSTKGGQILPRPAGWPRPQSIARTSWNNDVENFIGQLRTRWPEVCNSMFTCPEGREEWDIRWFFDEYDYYVQGPSFLFTVVHEIMIENERQMVQFCATWSRRHEQQWVQISSLLMTNTATPDLLFHHSDHAKWGRAFLVKAMEHIQSAYHRARLRETREAYVSNEFKVSVQETHSKKDTLAKSDHSAASARQNAHISNRRKSVSHGQNSAFYQVPPCHLMKHTFEHGSYSVHMAKPMTQTFSLPKRDIDSPQSAPFEKVNFHQYGINSVDFNGISTASGSYVQNFQPPSPALFGVSQVLPQAYHSRQFPGIPTVPHTDVSRKWTSNKRGRLPLVLPDRPAPSDLVSLSGRGSGVSRRGIGRWRGRARSNMASTRADSHHQSLPELPQSPRAGRIWQRGGIPPSEKGWLKNNDHSNDHPRLAELQSPVNSTSRYVSDGQCTRNANKGLGHQSTNNNDFISNHSVRGHNTCSLPDASVSRSRGIVQEKPKERVHEAMEITGRSLPSNNENEHVDDHHICKSFIGRRVNHVDNLLVFQRSNSEKIAKENVYTALASVESVVNFDAREGLDIQSDVRLAGCLVYFTSTSDARKVLQKGSIQLNSEHVRVEVPKQYWTAYPGIACRRHDSQDNTRSFSPRTVQATQPLRYEKYKREPQTETQVAYSPQDARGFLAERLPSSSLGIRQDPILTTKKSLDDTIELGLKNPNSKDANSPPLRTGESGLSIVSAGSPTPENILKAIGTNIIIPKEVIRDEYTVEKAGGGDSRTQTREASPAHEEIVCREVDNKSKHDDSERLDSLAKQRDSTAKSSHATEALAWFTKDESYAGSLFTSGASISLLGDKRDTLESEVEARESPPVEAEKLSDLNQEDPKSTADQAALCLEMSIMSPEAVVTTKPEEVNNKTKVANLSSDTAMNAGTIGDCLKEEVSDYVEDQWALTTSNQDDKQCSSNCNSPLPNSSSEASASPSISEEMKPPSMSQRLGSSSSSGSPKLVDRKPDLQKATWKLTELKRWDAEDEKIRAILDYATPDFKNQWYPAFAEKVERLLSLEFRLNDTTTKLNCGGKGTARKALLKRRAAALGAHEAAVDELVFLHGIIVKADYEIPRANLNPYPELHKPTASVEPDPSNPRRIRGENRDHVAPRRGLQRESVMPRNPIEQLKYSRIEDCDRPPSVSVGGHLFGSDQLSDHRNRDGIPGLEKASSDLRSTTENANCVQISLETSVGKTSFKPAVGQYVTGQPRDVQRIPCSSHEFDQVHVAIEGERDTKSEPIPVTSSARQYSKIPRSSDLTGDDAQKSSAYCMDEKQAELSYAKIVARSVEHNSSSENPETVRDAEDNTHKPSVGLAKVKSRGRNEWRLGPEGEWGQTGRHAQTKD